MGKKNIDKLFQEKFKDFSEVPDDKVWQSIETSLDKKKKSRKVIPIWWKLGGVAAILLVAITILNPFQDKPDYTPAVTEVDEETQRTSKEDKTLETFENKSSNEDQIVTVEQENISDSNTTSSNEVAGTNIDSGQDSKSKPVKNTSKQERFANQNALGVQVVNSDDTKVNKALEQNKTKAPEKIFDTVGRETEVAANGTSKTDIEQGNSLENAEVKDNRRANTINNSTEEGIAIYKEEESPERTEEPKKKSIFDEIAKQQEQEEIVVENSDSKWSAGPSIAPVYFSAIGEGSPVHSIFVPNSKSGDINLSYGLSVAYEVGKKLSIRSGIHKVDYGYRTNDVEFTSSVENASIGQIDNIDYTLTARSLVVNSKANTRVEASDQNQFINETSADVSAASPTRDGIMEQQFGYLEIPLELNYALLDSKFGINLIGGISSLFLVDNSISLTSGDLTTEMGEANNINSVNFSTNVGFGVNYKFSPKVQLDIEPVFKYQLNTFSETDGTFNPFSVGVYSGLSFKF